MQKNHTSKIFAVGIIVLFIGVSVSSAISVDNKSTISNNQSEECRECNEISDADFIKVERLLDKVEGYSKLLLMLSKYNPVIREEIEELSNEFTTLKKELADDPPFPFICDIIDNIINTFISIHNRLYELALKFEYGTIGWRIFVFIDSLYLTLVAPIWYPLAIIWILFDCKEPYYIPHLIS